MNATLTRGAAAKITTIFLRKHTVTRIRMEIAESEKYEKKNKGAESPMAEVA